MATILEFRRKQGRAAVPKRDGAACQIVFFTGVRYERGGPHDGRRPDQRPDDRAPDRQANLPG